MDGKSIKSLQNLILFLQTKENYTQNEQEIILKMFRSRAAKSFLDERGEPLE